MQTPICRCVYESLYDTICPVFQNDVIRLSWQRRSLAGNCSTKARLCVAIITAVPSAAIWCRKATICSPVAGSRLPVGSSARISLGLFRSARAITIRCCSPPDNCDGKLFILLANPTLFNISIGSNEFLHICVASSTFSFAVKFCTKL